MNPITTQQLLAALEWRYATKVFDPGKKISPGIFQALEQALVLSPSSYGLQPYRFLLINDPAKRAELLPHSWNQKQVVDCSHYLVFTARTKMTEADVDRYIALVGRTRNLPAESLGSFRGIMVGDLVNGPRSKIAHEWATRQAYIALGNLMTSAAVVGVDACPMEGFKPTEYDRVLGLANSDYASVVCCALGYRSANDKYARLAKVRYDKSDLVEVI